MIHEYGLTFGYSKIHIKCDKREVIPKAVEEIKHHIRELLDYVERNPQFRYSLKPQSMNSNAPPIIQRMIEASRIANVGPMASVAGAIADLGLEALLKMGSRVAVVENGGEIAAYTADKNIPVSVVTGEGVLSGKIGFLIITDDSPAGIATSTGKTLRTISFGEADSVTVIAENAALADAAATSICNAVSSKNIEDSIRRGLERAREISGVRGAMILRDRHVGLIGKLPKIIRLR